MKAEPKEGRNRRISMTERDKLKLKSDHNSLGVAYAAWKAALEKSHLDSVVGIRHAVIDGNEGHRNHVAGILDRVGCHFHAHGNEDYAIVAGHGTLYWGKAEKTKDGYAVPNPEAAISVKEGDSFTIPEGYAHQLKNEGDTELVIVFSCPDAHLDDKVDRTMLPALAP